MFPPCALAKTYRNCTGIGLYTEWPLEVKKMAFFGFNAE